MRASIDNKTSTYVYRILFAQQGARVVMSDVNEAALKKALAIVKEKSQASEGAVLTKVCDVGSESQVKDLIDFADNAWGEGVDIAFFNAGIMHPADDNALTTEEKIWDLTHKISECNSIVKKAGKS